MRAFKFLFIWGLFVFVNSDDAPIVPLPRTLSPTSYHLAIDVNLPKTGAPFVNSTSPNNGTVTIELSVVESTDTIVLNGANITIQKCQLLTVNSKSAVTDLTDIAYNNASQLITIKSAVKFNKSETIQIKIDYTYLLRVDSFGLFKFAYLNNNITHHVAATQFETMYARRMVPCFDDPSFRSNWTVEVKAPSGYTVLSNTEQAADPIPAGPGFTLTRFKPIPPIPSYLLAIAVHDYPYLENVTSTGIRYRFYGQQSNLDGCSDAFEFTGRLIDHLIERFKVVKFPSTKIDFIETGGGKGPNGMENIGLITFNTDTFCNMEERATFKVSIIHELVHQWFGNIITIKDWSNVAVKEGLTTYYTEIVRREIIDSQLHVEWLSAMLLLVGAAKKPLITNITSLHEVHELIGTEQYTKSPFLMGMLSQLIGPACFDTIVNAYLKDNAYGWGSIDTFFAAVDDILPSGVSLPISKIMKPYFSEVGFPVVFVEKHPGYFNVTPLYANDNSAFNTSAFIEEKKDFFVPIWYQPSDGNEKYLEIAEIGKSFNIYSHAEVLFIDPTATSWHHTVYVNDLVVKVAKNASPNMQHLKENLIYELSNYALYGFGGNFTSDAFKILKPPQTPLLHIPEPFQS